MLLHDRLLPGWHHEQSVCVVATGGRQVPEGRGGRVGVDDAGMLLLLA